LPGMLMHQAVMLATIFFALHLLKITVVF
jgi:hypothetical protein